MSQFLKAKGGPTGLGVEQTGRLSRYIGVVNDRRRTSNDWGGAQSGTEY